MKLTLFALAGALVLGASALQDDHHVTYDDTPFLPGSPYRVHGERPWPKVVTPAARPGGAPSDATVLFDGKDFSAWTQGGGEVSWKLDGEAMVCTGGGSIQTKASFGDCQLHLEFATPSPPRGDSQERGNSGVFLMGRYEVQVLDSFENPTYPDGQCSALYGQFPPLVNACREPGEWQTYDIVFRAPRFEEGELVSPARLTVFHNGVLTQNDRALLGATVHRQLPHYTPHEPKAPLQLQDHGNPIRYRNIWIRELDLSD